jgi:hypothetical protein
VLIGAPFATVSGHESQGHAYAFDFPVPSITISSPREGAAYVQGPQLHAGYSCSLTGTTVSSCSGPVASGATVTTSAVGQHTFTVDAVSSDGATATKTVTYTVIAPTPAISSFSESHKKWRRGSKLATESRVNHRKPPVGTRFKFKLNVTARVTLTFKPRHGKALSVSFNGKAGTRKVAFDGRISKRKKLAPGRYTVTISAVAQGNRARKHTLTFTIVS